MPTGYTANVQDGKITTLRDFALQCSRAFGALITMRDDRMDAPIPQVLKAETKYHDDRLTEARKLLDELPTMSAPECDAMAATEFVTAMDSHTKYAAERALGKQRYQEMLAKVEKWEVDPELDGLKSFMLEQLRDSIKHDCSENYRPEPPVRLTGERWREEALAKASRDMAYHTVERAKEIERTAGRNRWLAALWKWLPPITKEMAA